MRRYQRERPGELIHVDVKKIGGIPDGGGWRLHGRGNDGYRSGLWHQACTRTGTTVKKTRPRRPQTNGKVERFHRILLEEWAYIRPWTSDSQRTTGYAGFIHFYNHHRPHGALGWSTPTATLAKLTQDNLPGEHN